MAVPPQLSRRAEGAPFQGRCELERVSSWEVRRSEAVGQAESTSPQLSTRLSLHNIYYTSSTSPAPSAGVPDGRPICTMWQIHASGPGHASAVSAAMTRLATSSSTRSGRLTVRVRPPACEAAPRGRRARPSLPIPVAVAPQDERPTRCGACHPKGLTTTRLVGALFPMGCL